MVSYENLPMDFNFFLFFLSPLSYPPSISPFFFLYRFICCCRWNLKWKRSEITNTKKCFASDDCSIICLFVCFFLVFAAAVSYKIFIIHLYVVKFKQYFKSIWFTLNSMWFFLNWYNCSCFFVRSGNWMRKCCEI